MVAGLVCSTALWAQGVGSPWSTICPTFAVPHERSVGDSVLTRKLDVQALALERVGQVLGQVRARMLLETFLARREQARLTTPADLDAFGLELMTYGGTEETLGALIRRQAALLVAADHSP